ncbi:MAG: phosphate signaling complex protein PhoU [Oscillochloris sp.]|nr:phosphate signaling complex protein PhoU [Oscillochloris sp.]
MNMRGHFEDELYNLHIRMRELADLAVTAVARAIDALDRGDTELAAQIVANDAITDEAQQQLEQFAVMLIATQQPVAGDLRRIIEAILVGSELERIGDYAKRVAKLINGAPIPAGLHQLGAAALAILEHTLVALDQQDVTAAEAIGHEELTVDRFYDQARNEIILALASDPDAARRYADLLAVAHAFERISDRATNIAERIIFARNGELVELNP